MSVTYVSTGPSCRQPFSKDTIFDRSAFEPTDAELNGEDEDEDMEDLAPRKGKGKGPLHKGKGKARRLARRATTESDDEGDDVMNDDQDSEDENDDGKDMDDFIVPDGQVDDDLPPTSSSPIQRPARLRSAKRKAMVISDDESGDEVIDLVTEDDGHKSDATMHDIEEIEEEDEDEDKNVVFGWKKNHVPNGKIKLMPRFLPSTKMKVCAFPIESEYSTHFLFAVDDGMSSGPRQDTSRRKGDFMSICVNRVLT
jgi:hypothetical protein